MQGEYDKSRWFELITSGTVEMIQEELKAYPKSFLLNMVDNTGSRHTALFYLAQDRNLDRSNSIMNLLLSEGANPNYKDSLSQTALFFASRFGHTKQLEHLIAACLLYTSPSPRDS